MKTRTLFLVLILVLLGIWYFASRSEQPHVAVVRPNDPWVFRSVMDKQPRMITFALNDKLWASYSTDSCSLYKIWSGSTDFTGAVYNMRHGPQPMSVGMAWFENTHKSPWVVNKDGKNEVPRTDYKGHRYTRDGHAEIMYDLVMSDGQRIRINERPEFVERDRQPGFERTYTVENAPAGVLVSLKTNVASVASGSSVETDETWKESNEKMIETGDDLRAFEIDGELTLKKEGATHFRAFFVNKPLIHNPFDDVRIAQEAGDAGGKPLSPGEKVMAKNDCRTCHNPKMQTVGPGYKQISERYKNTPENLEMLAQKVMKGGSGVWGVAAMSAHPDLQPEDAKAMVSYVLSLDEGEDDGEGGAPKNLSEIPEAKWIKSDNNITDKELSPGLLVKVWQEQKNLKALADVGFSAKPQMVATAAKLQATDQDFGDLKENFAIEAEGYLFIEKDDNVVLQLSSDDGSRLTVDGRVLIDNDGPHGMSPKEAEIALRAGFHPVKLEYFQGGGGRGIELKWTRHGSTGFNIISESSFFHKKSENVAGMGALSKVENAIPGDAARSRTYTPRTISRRRARKVFCPK